MKNGKKLFGWVTCAVMLFGMAMTLPCNVRAEIGSLQDDRQLDNRMGLSHNTVYCIYQDRLGFMWFGTRYGLNRYDGNEFRIYHHTDDDGSIGGEYIQCIEEDANGCLWIGTDNGVSIYDPWTDQFSPFDVATADGRRVDGFVSDLCFTNEGNLWIISGDNLFCYSNGVLSIANDVVSQTGTGGHVHTLYYHRGYLHIALSDGIICSEDGGETFQRVAEYSFQPSVLSEYGPGSMLVGTRADGLYAVDFRTGELTLVPMPAGSPYDASQFYPYTITRLDSETFLIGSEWGLFSLENGELSPLTNYFAKGNRVDVVFDICKDRDGSLWVANNYSGIIYYPRLQSIFECHSFTGAVRELRGDIVRAVAEDAYGNLWIGTEDGGLNRLDALTRDCSAVKSDDGFDLAMIDIQDLTLVGGDEVAMGAYRGGLYLYNIETGRMRHYMEKADVMTVYERADHTLLFVSGGVVWQLDPDTEEEPHIFWSFGASATDLAEDNRGRLWLPLNDGLLRYNPSTGSIRRYTHDPNDSTSLCSNHLAEVFIDSRNRVWVASEDNGFCCYDEQKDAFWSMTMANGLPSDAVNTIAEDINGHLWVGTNDGMAIVDPETRNVQTIYTNDDGMPSKHVALKSARRLRSGDMAFGTFKGLCIANLSPKESRDVAHSVTLTELQIFNDEVMPEETHSRRHPPILKATMPYANSIVLPHKQNTFTLTFSTFDYRHREHGLFIYRLDGQDTQWNYVDNVNQVSYHNIPSGRYLFRIRAVDAHNHESGPETRLNVRILAPWWHTWFMRILYILTFVAVTWCIIFFYNRHRREREELRLSEKNQQKEKEFYQAKIDFFTNLAHEIRTPASLIRDPLHTLRMKGVPRDIDATLSLVERNADSLNTLINELLDFRKVEAGVSDVDPSPQDFIALVREVWEGFRPSAEARGLHIRIAMPDTPVMALADVSATRKIVRNLCSNALKYANSYIRLVVDTDSTTDSVRLSISNDGAPIPPDMRHKLFEPFVQIRDDRLSTQGTGLGLPLALTLAENQGGRLYIDGDAPDTTFVFHLPLADESIAVAMPADTPVETPTETETAPVSEDAQSYLLIVEDNDDLRTYLAANLAETYPVLEASNGVEALRLLRGHNVLIVLSDVMMPLKDGIALCRDIKTDPTLCHIPVVLLTAKDTIADHVRGLEGGADVYIPKPFDMEKLKAQLVSLLHNREILRNAFAHDPLTAPLSLAQSPEDERFLTKATQCVLSHITDSEWNVDDLADYVGMSRSTLTRKLKALTGQTPNEFVRLIRLRRAAELLIQEHYRVNEVSELVGFSNPHYFSTLFQQQFGIKPTEYAKQHQ